MVWGAIAAITSVQLIGALWHSPYFLGNIWIQHTFPNRSKESVANQAGPAYAMTLVSSAGTALMLNFILVNFFNVKSAIEAVKFAVGLASLTALIDAPHFAFSQRNIITFVIDHLFDAASLVAMAACIFYLK